MHCAGCGVELAGLTACPGCGTQMGDDPYEAYRVPALPDERWPLSAPESYVLRYRATGSNTRLEVFKIALVELVAREALTLRGAWVPRVLPGRRAAWLIADGARIDTITESALTPVVDAYERARKRRLRVGRATDDPEVVVEGVEISSLVRAATNRPGGIKGYVKRDVVGALRQRGLLTPDNERTRRGEDADQLLDEWMDLGTRHLWRQTRAAVGNRAWATAYLHGAGAAILLADELYPALARLGRADQVSAVSDQPFAFGIGPLDSEPASDAVDLSAVGDLSGLMMSFDALASLDGAFSVLSDGVGAAGIGGGGDGGGGGGA